MMANLENMRESAYELIYLFMDPAGYDDADGEQRIESLDEIKAELHATMVAIDQAIEAMAAMDDGALAEGEVEDDDGEESDEAA